MNSLIVNENVHKKIKLGETSKGFFKSPLEYCLESFPVSIVGCCGAGKTTDLLTFAAEYIKNKEGVIFFESENDSSSYGKLFSAAVSDSREQDMYLLNLNLVNEKINWIFGFQDWESIEKKSLIELCENSKTIIFMKTEGGGFSIPNRIVGKVCREVPIDSKFNIFKNHALSDQSAGKAYVYTGLTNAIYRSNDRIKSMPKPNLVKLTLNYKQFNVSHTI